ncbi:MAG: hypothetical protein ABR608_09725 [Pseudonocardiaceae bacterium]
MPTKSLRRAIALAGLVLLTAGTMAVAAVPAQAHTEVQLSVYPSTVHPGDTITVTQTITNVNNFTIPNPSTRLFSRPDVITSYTSPVSCSGAAGCDTLNGPDGLIGYQAVLPEALDAGTSAAVTFTLQISPHAPDLVATLQGQVLGSNYAMDRVDGPTLTVNTSAGTFMFVTATPKSRQPVPPSALGRYPAGQRADGAAPRLIPVRDSKRPEGAMLCLSRSERAAWISSAGHLFALITRSVRITGRRSP